MQRNQKKVTKENDKSERNKKKTKNNNKNGKKSSRNNNETKPHFEPEKQRQSERDSMNQGFLALTWAQRHMWWFSNCFAI